MHLQKVLDYQKIFDYRNLKDRNYNFEKMKKY